MGQVLSRPAGWSGALLLTLLPTCESSQPAGQARAGNCVSVTDCAPGELCLNGICVLGCNSSFDCQGNQACVSPGVCEFIPDSSCVVATDCIDPPLCQRSEGATCFEGQCQFVDDPGCDYLACSADGACVIGSQCVENSDCATGMCTCAAADCGQKMCAEMMCPECRFTADGVQCAEIIDDALDCDDANPCTNNDACAAGSCVGSTADSCDGGNPGAVADLAVSAVGSSFVDIRFTEVTDGAGAPASYDIRYGDLSTGWGGKSSVATGTCSVPVAGTSIGNLRTCRIEGLAASTTYSIQMVPFRGVLNEGAVFGPISSPVTAVTSP